MFLDIYLIEKIKMRKNLLQKLLVILLLILSFTVLSRPAFACDTSELPKVCGLGKLTVEECHYTGDVCCFAVWAKCLEPGTGRVAWCGWFTFFDYTAKITIIMKITEGQFAILSNGNALRLFSGQFGGTGYTTVYRNGVKLGSAYYAHVNLYPDYNGNLGEQYIQLYVQVPQLADGTYFMGGHPTYGRFTISQ